MRDMISALEDTFKDLTLGKTMQIPRSTITLPEAGGWIGIMPAYLRAQGSFSTKFITLYNGNLKIGLPAIIATVILNDPKTGEVLSIMDGGFITSMRTGGLGGLAAKFLSRRDSHVAGIFGAGVQARTQLKALAEVREIQRVLVYDTVADRAKKFSTEMEDLLNIPVIVVDSPRDVLKISDIITTVTPSGVPVFEGKDLRVGTHVSAFGNYKPKERELDTETIVRSKVYVDLVDAAMDEAGDVLIPINEGRFTWGDVKGTLGEVILGLKTGRSSDDDITLFKSVGLAIQDCAAAALAYKLAASRDVGKNVELY